jgi:hypothetical protein
VQTESGLYTAHEKNKQKNQKEVGGMNDMKIEASMRTERGNIGPMAQDIMRLALEWFQDPEHEKEYQEWKAAREARKGA